MMMKKILYLGNNLSKKGINQTTIETLSKKIIDEGFIVEIASNKKNYFIRIFDMVFMLLKCRKYDYLLIDTYSTSAFWYALITSQLARIVGLKYIPILHGGNLPNRLKKNPFLSKLIFFNAYINCAPSNYLLNEFKMNNFHNCILIPNSIEIENYSFKERTVFKPKLFWLRALANIYNPQMALNVLIELKKQFPDATLVMVGPDKEDILPSLKQKVKENDIKVIFTGKLTLEEWKLLAQDSDIFINTTTVDNTPVSVIEAMALGLPVISTNVGGLPYLIENNTDGFLVESGNVNQMVQVIKNIIDNPEFVKKNLLNARKKAESYSWNQVKYNWLEILK